MTDEADPGGTRSAAPRHGTVRFAAARRSMVVLLGLVGGATGFALAGQITPTYTAEIRLAVGSNDISDYSVPGYAQAVQSLASNYARYIIDSEQGASRSPDDGARADVASIQASPIPESNVVRIEVTDEDSSTALDTAAELGDRLIVEINAPDRNVPRLREKLSDATRQTAEAQVQLESLRAGGRGQIPDSRRQVIADAISRVETLQVEQEIAADALRSAAQNLDSAASLTTIRPAAITTDSAGQSKRWGGILGVGAGLLLGVLFNRRDVARWLRRYVS